MITFLTVQLTYCPGSDNDSLGFTVDVTCLMSLMVVVTMFNCWAAAYTQGDHSSWKVMEFSKTIFQAWKVMENDDDVLELFCKHTLDFLFL